jgi:hypothetical protein
MKDDEVLAHYARAGDGPPGVIPIGQLAERVLVAPPQPSILRTNAAPSVSDQGPAVVRHRRGETPFDEKAAAAFRRARAR